MAKPVTTQQQQQQQQLKFEDVSKYFNLPLSDAADSLGVSNATLKKICLDNGLVRWPYRKFLLGKSIEDIIKEAALEKKMRPELLKSTKDGKVDATKNTVSIGPVHEIPKLRSITQPTYKKIQTSSLAIVDEFRYGFPSNGLLRTSNKWWGNSTATSNKDTQVKADRNIEQTEQQSEKMLKSSPCKDEVGGQGKTDETSTSPQLSGTGLLSAMRKRALEEGQEALKLGFHQCSGINKLAKREKLLLQGIFGTSLPKEWTDVSS
ncbi:Glucan synthase-like 7 [Heracleum sosnowskyi]|uniref:Glucan synthase-like 7 n=1 Tax=Heracleum sosnowskyi TaxID=360622 RepID=A0AAD8JMX2_9APIA|nr:Glucan synthase-like 7 [Heracleum sosnowskyi]